MNSAYYVRFALRDHPNPTILTEDVRQNSNIGANYWEATLDQIPNSFGYKRLIQGFIKLLPQLEPEGRSLLIVGQHGSGKTALASIVIRNVIAREGRGYMISAADLFDKLIKTPSVILPNGASLEEALRNIQFLGIDDLKKWLNHEWKDRILETIVRARYDEQLPTIITTNLPLKDIQACEWLRSILRERFLVVEVAGIDWRQSVEWGKH